MFRTLLTEALYEKEIQSPNIRVQYRRVGYVLVRFEILKIYVPVF